jgi:hypothetical protein
VTCAAPTPSGFDFISFCQTVLLHWPVASFAMFLIARSTSSQHADHAENGRVMGRPSRTRWAGGECATAGLGVKSPWPQVPGGMYLSPIRSKNARTRSCASGSTAKSAGGLRRFRDAVT